MMDWIVDTYNFTKPGPGYKVLQSLQTMHTPVSTHTTKEIPKNQHMA